MTVVDANVILRYLLDDHKSLSMKARKIIDPAIDGERDLFVPQAVLATAHAQGAGYASFDKDRAKLERRLN